MVVRKIIGEHMIARLVGAAKLSLRHNQNWCLNLAREGLAGGGYQKCF